MQRHLARAVLALLLASPLRAHDSWLVPPRERLVAGDAARFAFVTSEVFPVGEAATDPARVARWTAACGERRLELAGARVEGRVLAASAALDAPGTWACGIALAPRFIEIEPDGFEAYLTEEGADAALAAWRAAGRPVGREHYTKNAVALVRVGGAGQDVGGRSERTVAGGQGQQGGGPSSPGATGGEGQGQGGPRLHAASEAGAVRLASSGGAGQGGGGYARIGLSLELAPLADPTALRPGDSLELVVLLEGRPLAGQLVKLGMEGLPPHAVTASARTDERGRVAFRPDAPGLWYARATAIRALDPARATPGLAAAQWESHWGALTFEVAPEPEHAEALESLRAIHGGAGPFAALGFVAGRRALDELGLARGAGELEVVHHAPTEIPYTCMLDGLQAATGASAGKRSLSLVAAGPGEVRTVFRDAAAEREWTVAWRPEALEELLAVPEGELGIAGYRVLRAPLEAATR